MAAFDSKFSRLSAVAAVTFIVTGCSTIMSDSPSEPRSGAMRPRRAVAAQRVNIPRETAEAHYLKAVFAQNSGDERRALEEMRAAAVLDPNEPRIRRHLVQLYVKEGNLEAATAQAFALVELEPDDSNHRLLVADLLAALGRSEEAIQAYTDVLATAPNNVEVLVNGRRRFELRAGNKLLWELAEHDLLLPAACGGRRASRSRRS